MRSLVRKSRRILHYRLNHPKYIHGNKAGQRIGLFISIPKNASKSILEILELGPNRDQEFTTSLIIYENHQRAAVLNEKYNLDDLFVFCFSRNPYDRCVSWYEYHRDMDPYRSMSFEAWIKQGLPHHFQRQNGTDYAAIGISPLLQYNYVEQYKVDFVGKLENFDADLLLVIDHLNALCDALDIDYRFTHSAVRQNYSQRDPYYESYYNDETRELVYGMLRRDFEFFGYEQ